MLGPKYYELVSSYTKKMLRKCVPPLFLILRCCYNDQNKVWLSSIPTVLSFTVFDTFQVIILENLMLSYADSLEKNHRFPGGMLSLILYAFISLTSNQFIICF